MDGYPWFKVVAADLLANEQFSLWSMEDRGVYLTLMCMAWREGSIPASRSDLARLLRVDPSDMERHMSAIRSRFNPLPGDPTRLCAPELDAQREANRAVSDKRSAAGKAGADARWHPDEIENGNRMPLPSESDGNPEWQTDAIKSQSQSQIEKETTTSADQTGTWCQTMPTKDGPFLVPDSLVATLSSAYPRKDVFGTLKQAKAWLVTNPSKQKTAKGMPRFLNAWFSRQPDTYATAPKPTLRLAE
jgi:uncharacterized protein YdaU (DUF1376 family)